MISCGGTHVESEESPVEEMSETDVRRLLSAHSLCRCILRPSRRCVHFETPTFPTLTGTPSVCSTSGPWATERPATAALFAPPAFEYVGLDLADGPNVDLVPPDPYRWDSLGRESFDLVISGQAFEHNPYFWITAAEIARVLVEGGLTVIIAPSRGPVHRHPFDCWRFSPDSWSVLCQYVGLELLESSSTTDRGARWCQEQWRGVRASWLRGSLASSTKRQEMPSTKVLTQSHGPAGHFRRRRSSTRRWGRRSGATNRSTVLSVSEAIRMQPERLLARALFRIGAGNTRISRHLYANSERFATRRGEQASPWPVKGTSD